MLSVVNILITGVAPVQPSDRVSEMLSERTLRYYISQGLVDRPSGKEGTSALYSYRHLLQLLALKRLQVFYFPMKKIREIIQNSTNDELKGIISGDRLDTSFDSGASIQANALAYLDSILPVETKMDQSERPGPSFEIPTSPSRLPVSQATAASGTGPPVPESWERFVLEDGIELHVRKERWESLRKGQVRRLFERLLKLFKD